MTTRADASGVKLDFVGVGFAKCGSSWIAQCLRDHPDVFLPRRKELHYFNDGDERFEPSLEALATHFADALPGQKLGEFTPRYAVSRQAIDRIRAAFADVRLIVAIRDPVERMISQYRFFVMNAKKENALDFGKALEGPFAEDYLVKSRYYEHIEYIYRHFDREHVHVVLFDDIVREPENVTRDLYRFVGVDDGFRPIALSKAVNRTRTGDPLPGHLELTVNKHFRPRGRKSELRGLRARLFAGIQLVDRLIGKLTPERRLPEFDPQTKRALYDEHFRDDVAKLEQLLGRDLSSWKPDA